MKPPHQLLRLLETFDRNLETYRSGRYNETQLRREFIDPFFSALGWDVGNTSGYAEPYKDVIHEDAIKIGAATKAPDYCFRIGGARKFFVEAKRPAVDIKGDIATTDQQIDRIVSQLYDLTQEEITIVEESTNTDNN